MDMILNNRFEEPYSRFAPESSLPLLSKTLVKSRLSNKFWKCTEKIYDDTNVNKNKQIQNEDNNNTNSTNTNINTNNINNNKTQITKKQTNNETEPDIETLKKMIIQLQNEITERNVIIEAKNTEILKLNSRIEELENELANIIVSTHI
jgi:septin family protein